MLWELFFKEKPEAKEWVLLDAKRKPIAYEWPNAGYRYFWNRNHTDTEAYHQKIVRYAVEEIRADLLHFDNYGKGPGWDACSVDRFRRYLAATLAPQERQRISSRPIWTTSCRQCPARKRRCKMPGTTSAAHRWRSRTGA